jgi:hypothetical protein
LDFFDDDDDAPSSDQPTRESRRIGEPDAEPATEGAPPRTRSQRPAPRVRGGRGAGEPAAASGGPGRPSRQQIRSRQLTLLGISIVILILLFLAFRGCLNAREERSYKNYVSDLDTLTVDTKQVSDEVFGALTGESSNGDIALSTEINGARGTMAGLTSRAQGLDAPDDVSGAQTQIALSYQMRQDALDVIAEEIPNAQGNAGSKKAVEKIEEQMRVLLASDVLFSRAQFEIEQALSAQEIVVDEGVPDSDFLPDNPDWLETSTIEAAVAGAGTGSSDLADCDEDKVSGTHGLALSSTTAQPEGVVLQPDGAPNSVTADGTEFEIAVENQGDSPESDINVTMDGDLTGSQTISSIEPAEIATVTIPPKPAPKAGDTASITVTVATVCGEQVDSNNESTYEITFG